MTSLFTSWTDRHHLIFIAALAVMMTAFLLGVGLGPDRLPFPPESNYSDAVTSHWPNALFLRRSVLDDHVWPLWRPTIMSGQAFAANPLNKVWYPPQWLVFVLPPTLHLNFLVFVHLIIAGAGAYSWSRLTGLVPWTAALAGFGYAFAPRLIASVGAGHLDLVYAAAWVPWMLWAIERVVPLNKRAALWLGVFAALCFLADVRLSAYGFALAAAYGLWRIRQNQTMSWRTGAVFVIAGLLTIGLTAIQWVPLLLMQSDLTRSTLSIDDAAIHSLEAGQWIGLFIGDHGGAWESLIYVGISTLVLAIITLIMQPRRFAFWGLVLVFIALYAMGDQFVLWTLLARLFPPLRWWRVPPRIWLLAALILPYLAGWGAQLLIERPPDRKIARLAVVGLLGGGMVCGLFSTLTLSPPLEQTAVLGLFALPTVALLILLAMGNALPPRVLLALFTLGIAADVLWIDRTLVEGRSEKIWLEPYREVAEYLKQDDAERVYSPGYVFPQQAAAYWDIPQFGGVDPFQRRDYVKAAEAAAGVKAEGYSVTIPAYHVEGEDDLKFANRDAKLNADLLGQWLVTHVISAYEIEADGLEFDRKIGDVFIYRNTRMPDVLLDWNGPNRVTIRAKGPTISPLFVVAAGRWTDHENVSPGLPGTLDGSLWTLSYDPSEVWLSLLIGSIGVALALIGWWRLPRA